VFHQCSVCLIKEIQNAESNIWGRKGSRLVEMYKMNVPIPHGLIISKISNQSYIMNESLTVDMHNRINELERVSGKNLGDRENPLILSVRSSPPISMPGVMKTILNLGMNDVTVMGLIKHKKDDYVGWNSYIRFIYSYSSAILSSSGLCLELNMSIEKFTKNLDYADFNQCLRAIKKIKRYVKNIYGIKIPDDPYEQLFIAIKLVTESINTVLSLSKKNELDDNMKLTNQVAVIICEMKYGNTEKNGCSGIVFSHDPITKRKEIQIEFGLNTQGDDIVQGKINPLGNLEFSRIFPKVYKKLISITNMLERYYGSPQDIEFTVEDGQLFILQSRDVQLHETGKRI
jgi:pyruvate, orthophosphate dikinase